MPRPPMFLGYDPVYTDGIDPSARFPRERYRRIAQGLQAAHDAGQVAITQPRLATRDELLLAHDADYVDAFLQGRLDLRAQRRIGLRPWTPAIVDRTLRLVGGSLDALDAAVATGGFGANLAGGTHHAFADMGGGYCVVNDLAICARRAQAVWGLERVLVVDLDVHQGDGTAAIFAHDPSVFTFSVHCGANYPFHKQTSDLDVALPVDTDDVGYLAALDAALPRALDHRPQLVLYQAGVDGLATDRLGRLALTPDGMAQRDQRVLDAVQDLGVPCAVFMGGGYGEPIDTTVEAFVRLFQTVAARHVAG